MKNGKENEQAQLDQQAEKSGRRQDNYGRRTTDQPRDDSSPGGSGSTERVPAKGNDLSREELQQDIPDEIENETESDTGKMREVERKRDDEGQDIMQDPPPGPGNLI